MASINLVTGYTGEAHVRSEDDALLNSFLAGQDNAVINLESEFKDNGILESPQKYLVFIAAPDATGQRFVV